MQKYNESKYTKIYHKEKQKLKREIILITAVKTFAVLMGIFVASSDPLVTIPITISLASVIIIYRLYSFHSSKKEYLNAIKDDGLNAKNCIYDQCLKDTYKKDIGELDSILAEIAIYTNNDKSNLLFDNREISILERCNCYLIENLEKNLYDRAMLSVEKEKNLRTLIKKISKYIKKDKYGEFYNQFRIYCASREIGQFSKKKRFFNKNDKQIKLCKKTIIKNLIRDGSKEKFDEIEKEFCSTYKLLLQIYTFHDEPNKEIIAKLVQDLDTFIEERVKKDTKSLRFFYEYFREYRFCSQICEFDQD